MIRSASFAARRATQTVTAFDNGPRVLWNMLRRSDDLEYVKDGVRVFCPNTAGARVPIYEMFAEDEYRMGWITQGLGPSPMAIDIGAHIGCFTLAFTKHLPEGRVTAFECTPSTYGYLERNVAANNLAGRVNCQKIAVSETTGFFEMADNGVGSGHNGVLHLGEAGSTTIKVPSVPMTEAFKLAGGSADLVKMDAEGAEYSIAAGSTPSDWSSVRRIVMEYHNLPGHSWDELESFFTEAGLPVAHRVPYTDGLGIAWLSRDPLSAFS